MIAGWLSIFLFHPLHGNGYQFWSGIGSDFGELSILVAMLGLYRQHNCHQHRCWRIGRFSHGHLKLCHKHHPLVPDDGRITAKHINRA